MRFFINDFSAGLFSDRAEYKIPPGGFRTLKGVLIRNGSLRLPLGGQRLLVNTSGASVLGFTRYIDGSGNSYLVYSTSSGVSARNEGNGITTSISALASPPTRFAQFFSDVIFVNNGALSRWSGSGSVTLAGVIAPTLPLYVGSGTSGVLTTAGGKSPIRYAVTYLRGSVESNASPQSDGIVGTNFQVSLAYPIPPATGITAINVYRTGGSLSRLTLVGTISAPFTTTSTFGGQPYGTYTDNLADSATGTIQLNYARDIAPSNLAQLLVAKSRLIAASNSTVSVSSLGQPDYFPQSIIDPLIDGVRFNVDPDQKNPIVALATSSASVLVARRKNVYLLQGNDMDSFSLVKYANIGCAAERSLVECDNISVFLAPDGMVYSLGAEGVHCLSESIRKTLKAIPDAIRARACACYFDRQYHLCFPYDSVSLQGGLYFIYQLDGGFWTEQSGAHLRFTQLYAESDLGASGEIIGVTGDGFLSLSGSATSGFWGCFGSMSGTSDIPVDVWSGDLEFDAPEKLKKVKSARLRGTLNAKAGTTPTITFYALTDQRNATPKTTSKSYTLNTLIGASGVLFDGDVDPSLVGHRISWRIQGTFNIFELDDVQIEYDYAREGRV